MDMMTRLLIGVPTAAAASLAVLFGLSAAGLDGASQPAPPPAEIPDLEPDPDPEPAPETEPDPDPEPVADPEPAPEPEPEPLDFPHDPPGDLLDTTVEHQDGSPDEIAASAHLADSGYTDPSVFAPDMRFPLLNGPAFANSQIMLPTRGAAYYPSRSRNSDNEIVDIWLDGVRYARPWGDQNDAGNYDYPWIDNFCEVRYSGNNRCGGGRGHQGQDIRPGSCTHNHIAVAAADGELETLSPLSVDLYADDEAGTVYRYLHLDRPLLVDLAPGESLQVTKGQPIGFVSNISDNQYPITRLTTVHLHFEMWAGDPGGAGPFAPYTSLVEAYRRLGADDPANHAPPDAVGTCSYPDGGIGPTRDEVLAALAAETSEEP